MDDREEEEKEEEGLLLFGEQSLTRFPHRGSRRNIYENVSLLIFFILFTVPPNCLDICLF